MTAGYITCCIHNVSTFQLVDSHVQEEFLEEIRPPSSSSAPLDDQDVVAHALSEAAQWAKDLNLDGKLHKVCI